MRYSAELAMDAAGFPTAPLIEALTAMQEQLGHWNDQITAARWLARFGRRRAVLANRAAWSARLFHCAAERARAADAQRERVLRDWTALDSLIEPWRAGPAEDEGVREDAEYV
jgi:CHAD domain-containing protein